MLFTKKQKVYVQVKNQNTSGTCDEKLAFAFDIARFGITDLRFDVFALVLLGLWWPSKPGIIEYTKRKCDEMEMLAGGMRKRIKAIVLVGPKETGEWLVSLGIRGQASEPPKDRLF